MNKFIIVLILFFTSLTCYANIVNDEYALSLKYNLSQAVEYKNYNFESTVKIPIELKIVDEIKSEQDLYEGQIVNFKVVKNIIYGNKTIISRGTIVPAKVSIIISPGMNGIPASIIFSDFKISNIKDSKLTNTYEIFGQDRSLLVFPLKWVLTILPPTGSLTNFIMGGHAKLKQKKHILIYYYPEWA